ncbi:MAG: DNA-3-methyladenine glycosylase [Planctomycetota bacterium]|nr:DNA-3-methyladenine glycosylase [Planctomycetota bacterium]
MGKTGPAIAWLGRSRLEGSSRSIYRRRSASRIPHPTSYCLIQMPISAQHIRAALTHLRKSDPRMKQVIREIGPFTHKLGKNRFSMLVDSILSQQISVAAARTIRQRLKDHLGESNFRAESLATCSVDELRSAGVSRQKAGYILDLAGKTVEGVVNFRGFAKLDNEQIIEQLTRVKGIGRWTAQMFLMFSMGRLDVFPVDDLGLQNAMKKIYGLDGPPQKETYLEIARAWHPYETVASWYCWQSLDNNPGG